MASKEVLSKWSRPLQVGPVDFPTEFRLVMGPSGNAPQYAQLGRSSNHFESANLPRGQGLHPQIEWVPNFQKMVEISNRLQHSSQMPEFESLNHDGSAEMYSKSFMSLSSPDTRWNQLISPGASFKTENKFFRIGERVLARYHGGNEWWKARVSKIIEHDSGALWFDVIYDARSECERGLPSYFLKPDSDALAMKKGDKVKVRYRGRASWHVAEIVQLSSVQPWMGAWPMKGDDTSGQFDKDDATVLSNETRTMHGVGTDKIQLSNDYLLYDDHRAHHLNCGGSLTIQDDTSLPEGYDPDLLVYDVRYPGGKIELSVPRHLIRREPEKKQPPKPVAVTSTHEELGFLLRRRTHSDKHDKHNKTLMTGGSSTWDLKQTSQDGTMGTARVKEVTNEAAQTATDLRHQLVLDSENAAKTKVVREQRSEVTSGARSTVTLLESFAEIKQGSSVVSEFNHSWTSKLSKTPASSRLHNSTDNQLEGYGDDQFNNQNPSHDLKSSPKSRTLVVDHTVPRRSLQDRLLQQGRDRHILRSVGARRADPDGVIVPKGYMKSPTAPVSRAKYRKQRNRVSSVNGHAEDETSLAGWSGGTGFGASVGSFSNMSRQRTSSAPDSVRLFQSRSLTGKETSRSSKTSRQSQDSPLRNTSMGLDSNEDLFASLTLKDPMASRVHSHSTSASLKQSSTVEDGDSQPQSLPVI